MKYTFTDMFWHFSEYFVVSLKEFQINVNAIIQDILIILK